jgi:RNA polymerase sigma factor (TIGR02999 family)
VPIESPRTASPISSHEIGDGDVTRLLESWSGGSRESLGGLICALYQDLKRMALRSVAIPDDTLQATVIVNAFYLRLLGQAKPKCENREHFVSLAARVMRQIRIDHARRNAWLARDGTAADSAPAEMTGSHHRGSEMLHAALNHLESFDRRKATMLDLRYFAGMSMEEVASVLDVSTETVRKQFRLAESWLASFLGPAPAARPR